MLDKIKKIAAVVGLTIVIWAWSYLALEKTIEKVITIDISQENRNLLVSFVDREKPVRVEVELQGQPAMVTEFQELIRPDATGKARENLEFFYSPDPQNVILDVPYQLNILQFLEESGRFAQLGLNVVSCNPESIRVRAEKLVEKEIPVRVIDENGMLLNYESVRPARIKVFVRENWEEPASVKLNRRQIEEARQDYVIERAYFEITPGEIRYAVNVRVELPSTELTARVHNPATVGYIISRKLQGKYKIELLVDSLKTIRFQASDEAFNAYTRTSLPQILIEVRDSDENIPERTVRGRDIIYNFPQEYIRRQEIQTSGPALKADFRLVPINGAPEEGAPEP